MPVQPPKLYAGGLCGIPVSPWISVAYIVTFAGDTPIGSGHDTTMKLPLPLRHHIPLKIDHLPAAVLHGV